MLTWGKMIARITEAITAALICAVGFSCDLAAEPLRPTRIEMVRMSDGVEIAVGIYLPPGDGRFPALFAASPYRIDNDIAPAIPLFLQRESGPADFYLKHGYAFVRMDVRGTGRSLGEYRYQDQREQRDLYEVIEWIGKQPWSTGKVGGIGQSYYARMQWLAAVQNPPSLACIAPYDGNVDTYNASAYTGGIPGRYPSQWYSSVRANNQYPSEGKSRLLPWDYIFAVQEHTLYDDFWRERSAFERLPDIRIPVFSMGVWSKMDLHLNGNIIGYQRAGGPKKLMVFGSSNMFEAVAEYSSDAFHQKFMLPFYDWCLKGQQTSYVDQPEVRYAVPGSTELRNAETWPPKGVAYTPFYLAKGPSGSVTSLNDGLLTHDPPTAAEGETQFTYPDPGWTNGVVGPGPRGGWDPVRRVNTFVTEPLAEATEIAGPVKLVLYASSASADTDFIVKVSEQMAQPDEARKADDQPRATLVTKGWLRASHRRIDAEASRENAPWYTHDKEDLLVPGKIYKFEIAIMPTAYQFKKGSRIRLEIANGDSPVTDGIFSHFYTPNNIGRDTYLHNSAYPSALLLPLAPTK